jgi:hypothetical protein
MRKRKVERREKERKKPNRWRMREVVFVFFYI